MGKQFVSLWSLKVKFDFIKPKSFLKSTKFLTTDPKSRVNVFKLMLVSHVMPPTFCQTWLNIIVQMWHYLILFVIKAVHILYTCGIMLFESFNSSSIGNCSLVRCLGYRRMVFEMLQVAINTGIDVVLIFVVFFTSFLVCNWEISMSCGNTWSDLSHRVFKSGVFMTLRVAAHYCIFSHVSTLLINKIKKVNESNVACSCPEKKSMIGIHDMSCSH